MELQDILKIQDLVNKVNKTHKSVLITELGTDYINISPTDEKVLHDVYIGNIIKFTEGIGRHWFIQTDEFGLTLHCF